MAYHIIREHQYPEHDTYSGKADRCAWDFDVTPDPLVSPDDAADNLVANCEAEVAKKGGTMLKLELWVDTSPIFETKFRCIAYAYRSDGATIAIAWWGIVLILMLGMSILFIILRWVIRSISEVDWGGPLEALQWWAIGAIAFAVAVGIYVFRPKGEK